MFGGIYYGAMYGGSTTSILLNTPARRLDRDRDRRPPDGAQGARPRRSRRLRSARSSRARSRPSR
jgi:hypothetical protein